MNISSRVLLAGGDLIAFTDGRSIYLSHRDGMSRTLASGYDDIRFLTASRYGEYLAFWSITGESFRLIDLTGRELWSSWMNSDKAVPTGVKFSASGDAVACFFHFDGVPGIFFCDIEHGCSTIFGCCGRPIGHDIDLQYFALSDYDPYEYDKLAFYEKNPDSGGIIKLPPEVISRKLDNGPLIIDRNRRIVSSPVQLKDTWQGIAIRSGMTGFVILKDCNLYWFTGDSDKPEITIKGCIPESDRYKSFRTLMSLCGDNALIQIGDRSTVVNRNHGTIWRGNDLVSATIQVQRVLAQYSDGTVEVVQSDGSIEMRYTPPAGSKTVAAGIFDNALYIACISGTSLRLEVKNFSLTVLE